MMPNCDMPAWSLRLMSELDAADQPCRVGCEGAELRATELEAEIRRMERRSMPGAPPHRERSLLASNFTRAGGTAARHGSSRESQLTQPLVHSQLDRKSTRLNSSH